MRTLVEQATDLAGIPKNWSHQREEATELVLIKMAREIERLSKLVEHLCPDKSSDV